MPYCRLCETVFPTPTELESFLAAYVADLPQEERAPEALMAQRLAQCRACPYLRVATCALCGCYVQARCAKLRLRCPATPPRW